MKKFFLFTITCFVCQYIFCQPIPDSVLTKYHSAQNQRDKSNYLLNYLSSFPDDSTGISKAIDILSYFKKQNDQAGADLAQTSIAGTLNRNGDYVTGLNMCLSVLPSCEKRKDTIAIIFTMRTIAACYEFAQNFEQSLYWGKRSIPYVIAMNNETELSHSYNNIGATYAKAMMPDSGLLYAQQAVNIDLRTNNQISLPFTLSTLAENYIANKNYDLALPFLRKALDYAEAIANRWGIAFTNLDFSQAYLGLKNYDSAIYYAQNSIRNSGDYKETMMKSYEILYKSFETIGRQDSLIKYFKLATAVKDSVYNIEKTNNVQAINFREQLRQQEIEAEKAKAEEERKTNIQYVSIGIGIIFFISLFLLLSRSIIVNERVISFLGILGLLVVFEFINLIFHPFIASFTNHSPVWMLAVLVGIAALLIPLHNKLEHWIKHKMVEKNKKIRLAAAKKTIEQLEKDKS
ncbi:MAG TPA: tetratricopeptide repeat protein [Chitinophagaceae bacterium]|nr:tetratricopeptide repeat protein [Chitinophagaceae bacterium]